MMCANYTVYKHTAPNGKVYIGITSMDPKKRWNNGHGYQNNKYFSQAIRKYGWDQITHEILFTNLTREVAEQKERMLIIAYKSNCREFGYNLTDGGEVGKRHSQESIEKMRQAKLGKYKGKDNPHYGKKNSEETKQRISAALTGMFAGERNPNYGKKLSEEQKAKISSARKGKHYPKLSEGVKNSPLVKAAIEKQKIPVDQFTKDGQYVRTWASAADASQEL